MTYYIIAGLLVSHCLAACFGCLLAAMLGAARHEPLRLNGAAPIDQMSGLRERIAAQQAAAHAEER